MFLKVLNRASCDGQGWAPLHSAVSAGYEIIAQDLLAAGAEIDAETSGKRTPLHYAVSAFLGGNGRAEAISI